MRSLIQERTQEKEVQDDGQERLDGQEGHGDQGGHKDQDNKEKDPKVEEARLRLGKDWIIERNNINKYILY